MWDDDTLDGQILVQFLAQSAHESFATMLRALRDTLATPNGDAEHSYNGLMLLSELMQMKL